MFLVFGHLVVIWTYHLCNCYIYVDIFSLMAFTCVWISLRLLGSMNQVAHIYFLFVPVDGYFEIKVGYYFHMSSEILVHRDWLSIGDPLLVSCVSMRFCFPVIFWGINRSRGFQYLMLSVLVFGDCILLDCFEGLGGWTKNPGGRVRSMYFPWIILNFIPGSVIMLVFYIIPHMTMVASPWGAELIAAGISCVNFS